MGIDLVKTVPLVFYRNGERLIVGEASVYEDGRIEGTITDPIPELDVPMRDLTFNPNFQKRSGG
jgi:hypothetical protein